MRYVVLYGMMAACGVTSFRLVASTAESLTNTLGDTGMTLFFICTLLFVMLPLSFLLSWMVSGLVARDSRDG